jgi:hypothetical protein
MNKRHKATRQTVKQPQTKPPKEEKWEKAATLICDVQVLLMAALEILVLLDHASNRILVGAELALVDLAILATVLLLVLSHYARSAAKPKARPVPADTARIKTIPDKAGEEEAVSYSYFDITQFRHNIRPDRDIPPDD